MANAIREKWKNNWPDAYASPVAFREYITETERTTPYASRSLFRLYLRSILLYIKMRVIREQNLLIKLILLPSDCYHNFIIMENKYCVTFYDILFRGIETD